MDLREVHLPVNSIFNPMYMYILTIFLRTESLLRYCSKDMIIYSYTLILHLENANSPLMLGLILAMHKMAPLRKEKKFSLVEDRERGREDCKSGNLGAYTNHAASSIPKFEMLH